MCQELCGVTLGQREARALNRFDLIARRALPWLSMAVYVLTVLYFTILGRSVSGQPPQLEFFWSYREWLAGDALLGREIALNIALFVPIGFLLSTCLGGTTLYGLRRGFSAVVLSALFSLVVEMGQLMTLRGLFEWDDLISNTVGALIGVWMSRLILDWRHGGIAADWAVLVLLSSVWVCSRQERGSSPTRRII